MKVFGINLKLPEIKFADPKEGRFVLITGGIILLTLLIGILPNIYGLVHVSSKMSQMKAKARVAEEKIKNLPRLRSNRKNYTNQISGLEKQFFDLDQISELIGTISEMAKESGVVILSSKQYEYKSKDEVSKNRFYRPILFRLKLEGAYHNFGKFVNLLENDPKFIRVTEMNVEVNEEKKSQLAIELSILTFIKVEHGVSL